MKISDPFKNKCPPEDKCLVCKSSKEDNNCKVANVGYRISCKLCKERNKTRAYEGETGRTAYIRGKEHLKDLETKKEKSVMYKHVVAEHEEEKENVTFEMKIVGRFRDPMSRIIDESIRINNRDPETLLNSKTEFYGPAIRRKVLENKGTKPANT